ncbi:MAG: DUF349 domain-containing protein [Bacteroidales bacterium]|jgi:hypothetical protein|nr:DUF349 domain-containing protein [Bacteroidales bacterium]
MDAKDHKNSDSVHNEQHVNNDSEFTNGENKNQAEDTTDHPTGPEEKDSVKEGDSSKEQEADEKTQSVAGSENKEKNPREEESPGDPETNEKNSPSVDVKNEEEKKEQEKEASENDPTKSGQKQPEEIDYNTLSREQMVEELRNLIDNQPINQIRKEVEAIKASFYKKQKVVNEKVRKAFINEGGDLEEFTLPEDPLETELKEQFKRYRKLKAEFNRELEKEKETNLETKYQVIEELKELINKKESIGETFKEFRELQNRWKEIGPVPQQKLKDLWNTYHHHVSNFYDYIKINKELRDLDLKKNLEAKTGLCEKAEKLLDEPSVVNAFKALQKLHNQWREIGPVPNEHKEPIWERFKEATRIINKNHQDYFKNLKEEQKENLARKEKLCEQAEEIASKELKTHKEWTDETKAIIDLQKVWRTIGFAPKKDNNKIYARFRNACDKFFGKKREFYAMNKELQEENLEKKVELCEKAEAIKDSTDWKKTTSALINLQKEWKEAGPVPRKQSDKVWKRFRAACDHFFNRKSEYYATIDKEYEKNLELKQALIEKVKNYEFSDNVDDNYEALRKFQDEWAEIGFVPYKMKDKIQNDFREALNKQFDRLKIDDSEKKLLKFKTKLDNIQHKPKASNKMRHERDKFFNKIKKLESNITLWENNIGFFNADSTEAKEMISDYKDKITSAKEEIEILEEKIRMIDNADS